MLLALPSPSATATLSPAHVHTRSTRRPKLSLNITAETTQLCNSNRLSSRNQRRRPQPLQQSVSSVTSPTSRNTYLNATMFASSTWEDESGGSSGSSSDEDEVQDKTRGKGLRSSYHPTTVGSGFGFPMPNIGATLTKATKPTRAVRFSDAPVEVFYRHEVPQEAEAEDDVHSEEEMTAMQKQTEIEELKKWVESMHVENGTNEGSEKEEWVRKLVRLEMEELEREER